MDSFWPCYVWLIKIVFMNHTNSANKDAIHCIDLS